MTRTRTCKPPTYSPRHTYLETHSQTHTYSYLQTLNTNIYRDLTLMLGQYTHSPFSVSLKDALSSQKLSERETVLLPSYKAVTISQGRILCNGKVRSCMCQLVLQVGERVVSTGVEPPACCQHARRPACVSRGLFVAGEDSRQMTPCCTSCTYAHL